MVILLIRYNELGLKSPPVRRRFQKQLIRNIEEQFLNQGLECFIRPEWGRIFVETEDMDTGISILRKIFGITSVSPVISSNSELASISEKIIDYAKQLLKQGQSFALRTRRTGIHNYTSMSLAERIGPYKT